MDAVQINQFDQLGSFYFDINQHINLISRKDIQNVFAHHILHSLAIQKFVSFQKDSAVLDLGTGGGLPGLPLAILNPDVTFELIDARKKKIAVVEQAVELLKLTNVKCFHLRAEECKKRYDFVLSRAVAPLSQLMSWSRPLIKKQGKNAIPNGLITLKGGDLKEELGKLREGSEYEMVALQKYFDLEFYETKKLIYVPL